MSKQELNDIVAQALKQSQPHQQGLALENISSFDWDSAEASITQLQELPFRQDSDFAAFLDKKDELLRHLKHFSIENALDVQLNEELENNLRPFISCAYSVATKHLNVFEKAFANVSSPKIAEDLIDMFEAWKDGVLECNHTFQDIRISSVIQNGERAFLNDYYHKNLFCFTLMQDKVCAILSEALSPFIVSNTLYKGYDEQEYLYNVVLTPPSDELKNGLKSFLQLQDSLLHDKIDADLEKRIFVFHTVRGQFHDLFKQVYRNAQARVDEAKETISERISRLDHPRDELITRFECEMTFHLDLGLSSPLGQNPKIIVETPESIMDAFTAWQDSDRQDEEAHALAFAEEFVYQTMQTVLDSFNTTDFAGDAYPIDEDDESSNWQSSDDDEMDDMDCN